MTGMTYDIVAGYDGLPGSAQAVRWAAREALARDTTLTVCLACRPDHMELASQPATWELAGQDGKKILACGLPYAELVLGPGRVHAELVGGPAASAMRAQPYRRDGRGRPDAGTASCPACGWDRFPGM